MDPLDMVEVCPRCYHQLQYSTARPGGRDDERLRKDGCCDPAKHQWNRSQPHYESVTTVIDASGAWSIASILVYIYRKAYMR